MIVAGVDFTSSPKRGGSFQAVAWAEATGDQLRVFRTERVDTWDAYRAFLANPEAEWIGIDHPFGLPRAFSPIASCQSWSDMASKMGGLTRPEFRFLVENWSGLQPPGLKRPRRDCDIKWMAQSPVNVVRPPVGLMFHSGTPLLAESNLSIIGLRETEGPKVIEVYPGATPKSLGKHEYKRYPEARKLALEDEQIWGTFGFKPPEIANEAMPYLKFDPNGDMLDAVIGAAVSAWAARQPDLGEIDPLEGKIINP